MMLSLLHLMALVGGLAASQFATPGQISLRAKIDGKDHTQDCRVAAYPLQHPEDLALDGEMREALSLAPGLYQLRVSCRLGDDELVSVIDRWQVRSGQSREKKLSLHSARLVVNTRREGARINAEIQVLDKNTGICLAKGRNGNLLHAAAGPVRLRIRYTSDKRAKKQSVVERELRLAAGRTTRLEEDLSDSILTVGVQRNGKRSSGLVTLFAPGSTESLMEFSSWTDQLVPSGTYDIEVSLDSAYDFSKKRLRKVRLAPRAHKKINRNFKVGRLQVDSQIQGVSVPSRVYLYRPGAPEYFNFADSQQAIDLAPRKYEIRVVLDDSVAYDAIRPQVLGQRRRFVIAPGQTKSLRIDFSPGYMLIQAHKNKQATPAATTLWLHHPRVKLGGAAAGDTFAVAAGRYDVEVLFPNGRGGEIVPLLGVTIKPGQTTTRQVNIQRGNLTIDTYDNGVRVDAEVRFFKKNSQAALLVVRGGEAAELAPGLYEVQIAFGKKSRWVSAMRVKPGSWDVRRVGF